MFKMGYFLVSFLLATSAILGLLRVPVSSFSPSSVQQGRGPFFIPNAGWYSQAHKKSSMVLHSTKEKRKRKPSKVTDEDGPTPDLPPVDIEEVDDIPELREIEDASEMPPGPIPHQPWRRGETDGCEDPISADWRVEAESLITKAAELVGGKVIDVTWYLTAVLVTLDDKPLVATNETDMAKAPHDLFKSSGPVIEARQRRTPLYYDPDDPKPEEIWVDEDDIVYQRETEEGREDRLEKKKNMYATKDESDPEDEAHIPEGEDDTDTVGLYMNEETREDAAYTVAKDVNTVVAEKSRLITVNETLDSGAISTIAGAIIETLEDAEEELRVLSRHELVLTSPAPPGILETQKQFDAHRGDSVIVETQDPWESNRVLKGKLLDRNSMDVLINKKGRMVTIPLNFVKAVKLAVVNSQEDVEEFLEYEEEEEDE